MHEQAFWSARLSACVGAKAVALVLLAASPNQASWGQASDAGARMVSLGQGVYAIIHADATREWPSGATDWPHGNTGVVVGDDGVLVIDATYLPARARADIALIRTVTDKPVKYLINTHWHGDHTHGNGTYREIFPNIRIVGQRANRHFIELNLARYPRRATAPGSPNRLELQRLERLVATRRDSAGRPVSPQELDRLAVFIRERREELAGLAAVAVEPPDLLFESELTLHLGSRRVEIRNWDRANSPADITVYIPEERVLFTGDIVVHPVPYAWNSHPLPWIDVLRRLEAIPISALVPGHGPVQTDHRYTRQVRALFEAAASRVTELLREGKSLDQIVQAVSLDDHRDRFVSGDDPTAPVFWESSIKRALVERSFDCLIGYRC